MWVATADLPTSAGHPFYARLNRVLDDAGFDTFVEAQCAQFYADGIGRPSLAPGRYFRLLLLGYFEGLDSERAIAWRAADSLSIRQFLDFALHEVPPDHSTLSRHAPADRRRDAPSGVHVGVAAAGGRPPGEGAHHWDRRDDTRSQRGDAEHRAAGHGRRVRGVADPARRGVRYRHADAGRAGPIRSHAEEEGIQQRLDAPRRSGREDHADEGRPDPFGSQSRGGGGPGDRGHRRRPPCKTPTPAIRRP